MNISYRLHILLLGKHDCKYRCAVFAFRRYGSAVQLTHLFHDGKADAVSCFDEHMICANEELLKQVWINLLDNAIKFSEPRGTVSVDISEAGDRLSISVSNQGRDIPKDRIAHIFNKFYTIFHLLFIFFLA